MPYLRPTLGLDGPNVMGGDLEALHLAAPGGSA